MQTIKFGGRAHFWTVFEEFEIDPLTADGTATPTDPSTVALKLRDPNGIETAYTWAGGDVVRDGVGEFHFDATMIVSGQWRARWVCAGAIVAADEFLFRVEASAFSDP